MFRRYRALAKQAVADLATPTRRRYAMPVAVSLCLFAVLAWFNVVHRLADLHGTGTLGWVDEALTAILVVGLFALWHMWARGRDLQQEANRRAAAEEQLTTALHTMHHGISMFDPEGRLQVCNSRYVEIYRLPPELAKPGTQITAILDYRHNESGPAEPTPEEYHRVLLANLAKGGPHTVAREFIDGRCVLIVYEPREGGGWVSTHEDITERRRLEQRLNYLAHHDSLTELANRTLLRERLELALAEVGRGESLAVLCLDLDHFKIINDTLGHPVGDELLKRVGAKLSRCVRKADLVARMGGDEFIILQIGVVQPMAATTLAARIIETLAEPHDIGGHHVTAGTSIGIAIAPADGIDPEQLMKNADMALYLAKGEGRGVYRFFEAEMDRRMHARRRLEMDLREALGKHQFVLYYQPILDVLANQIRGMEALIRWRHPERGLVSPAEFIPLAEETGLIVPIGEWALRQACREAAAWPQNVSVAVNVSAIQFKSRTLVNTVLSALAASGLAPHRLELEITESMLLQDSEGTLAMLHQLRALGVRIAMDDFGTGYSSLSYFQRFPFDKIKIDRSFIQGLSEGTSAIAILRAISSLAGSLGITTLVEGVETDEQLAKVRHEGIAQVQGYLISPPRPIEELETMMVSSPVIRMAG